jgi:hypothetical protein
MFELFVMHSTICLSRLIVPLDSQRLIVPLDSQRLIVPLDSQRLIIPLDSASCFTSAEYI